MKRILTRPAVLTALVVTAPAIAGNAAALKGAKFLPIAHVTLAVARAAALKTRPGTITDQELEKETGRQRPALFLRYQEQRQGYEVGIDAKSGAVLENSADGPQTD